MIPLETPLPALRPPQVISSDEDYERLDRVLGDLMKEDQWIDDFMKRLNCTIEDIVRKK
jgi:hypothetical protein